MPDPCDFCPADDVDFGEHDPSCPNADPTDWAPPRGIPRPLIDSSVDSSVDSSIDSPTVIEGGSGPFTNTMGFDPCDYDSWPYGFDGPEDLMFDPLTEDDLPSHDAFELLAELNTYDDDGPSERRTLEMALRFFLHLASESPNRAFDPRVCGLAHTDIFAACLHTALIWERG